MTLSVYDLTPAPIDGNDLNHNIDHEIIHATLRGDALWAPTGNLLDYDESQVDTSTASTTTGVLMPQSNTLDPLPTPALVWYGGQVFNGSAGGAVDVSLAVDGTEVDRFVVTSPTAAALFMPLRPYRLLPSESGRILTLRLRAVTTGTAHAFGSPSVAGRPPFPWVLFTVAA